MKKTKTNHVLAVCKAGVSAVPVVGAPLASLIGDYIPTATQKSVDRALEFLREHLEALEHRIDVEAVDRDDFAELFKSCYLTIVRSHRDEKLRAATAILANLLLREGDPDKLTYSELDHFSRCAETLSSGAVEVLAHVVHVAHSEGREAPAVMLHGMSFGDLSSRIPEYSPELLMGLVAELDRANLLHRVSASIQMPHYGNHQVKLTPLGERFSQFLLE